MRLDPLVSRILLQQSMYWWRPSAGWKEGVQPLGEADNRGGKGLPILEGLLSCIPSDAKGETGIPRNYCGRGTKVHLDPASPWNKSLICGGNLGKKIVSCSCRKGTEERPLILRSGGRGRNTKGVHNYSWKMDRSHSWSPFPWGPGHKPV